MKAVFFLCLVIFVLRFHLPVQLSAQTVTLTGTVASLPETHFNSLQFLFIPDKDSCQKIWVSWYRPPPVHVHVGDNWQFQLRLKPTDKKWLWAENINATGNVQFNFKNQLMERKPWKYPLAHIREGLYRRLKNTLTQEMGLGFISALTLGMRDQITSVQWEDLRGTGTNHLMAIAGLHIGFVSGMVYTLISFLWRRSVTLMLWRPAQEAAASSALVAAFCYSLLSGLNLPAQRALIMLSVFLAATICRWKLSPWSSYGLALGLILAFEPLNVLTPTFWLSFTAVGLLIYGNSGRIGKQSFWQHVTRAQWVMFIGLMPLGFLFFAQFSFTGFIANCIAIPWVGFVILPLCLLGLLHPFFWKVAAFLLMHFWPVMHGLSILPHSQWMHTLHAASLLSVFMSVMLLLAPRGFPYRWMGLWGLLPLFLSH